MEDDLAKIAKIKEELKKIQAEKIASLFSGLIIEEKPLKDEKKGQPLKKSEYRINFFLKTHP